MQLTVLCWNWCWNLFLSHLRYQYANRQGLINRLFLSLWYKWVWWSNLDLSLPGFGNLWKSFQNSVFSRLCQIGKSWQMKEVCQNFILILPSANSSIFLSFSSQQLHSEMFDTVIQGVTLTWDYNYIHITQKKPNWFNVCCNVDTIIQIYHIFSIIKANKNFRPSVSTF